MSATTVIDEESVAGAAPADLERVACALAGLRRSRRFAEVVIVRIHLLRLTLEGAYPGDLDEADAGLTDAIDRLRKEELLRVVMTVGLDHAGGTDHAAGTAGAGHPDHAGGADHAGHATGTATLPIGSLLAGATDELRETLDAFAVAVAYLDPWLSTTRVPAIAAPPARLAMLRRLVERAIPPSLTASASALGTSHPHR